MKFLVILVIWLVILIFNAVYSFLPTALQNKPQIRYCAIGVAIIILIYGVYQIIYKHQSEIYAHILKDGTISKLKNFPWKVVKTKGRDGEIIYILESRYGDSSLVSIKIDKKNEKNKKNEIYNAMDGVGIKFFCTEEDLSDFLIKIRK